MGKYSSYQAAVKVKIIRENAKRETYAWFAPSLNYQLVRLQQFKEGEEIDTDTLIAGIAGLSDLSGKDLASVVTTKEVYNWQEKRQLARKRTIGEKKR